MWTLGQIPESRGDTLTITELLLSTVSKSDKEWKARLSDKAWHRALISCCTLTSITMAKVYVCLSSYPKSVIGWLHRRWVSSTWLSRFVGREIYDFFFSVYDFKSDTLMAPWPFVNHDHQRSIRIHWKFHIFRILSQISNLWNIPCEILNGFVIFRVTVMGIIAAIFIYYHICVNLRNRIRSRFPKGII